MRHFYVYIMASKSRVLYTGMTNDLQRRVGEHKSGAIPGFTRDYKVHRLVYYEEFKYVGNAIDREKQIKGLLREKKAALIRSKNPTWEDLSLEWASEKQVLRYAQDDKSRKGIERITNRAWSAEREGLEKKESCLSLPASY